MAHSPLALATLLALAGVAFCAPWPASGELAVNGPPAILTGAWFQKGDNPQYSLIQSGTDVSQRLNNATDGQLTWTNGQVSSFECIDDQTVRYIMKSNVSDDTGRGANQAVATCTIARLNATHRIEVTYEEAEGKCPDVAALDAAGTGPDAPQVFTRVGNVFKDAPVLKCENVAVTPERKPFPFTPPVGGEKPIDLGTPLGTTTIVGVWSSGNAAEVSTIKGFSWSYLDQNANHFHGEGRYLSHRCINDTAQVAALENIFDFGNGTRLQGYGCTVEVRNDDTLDVWIAQMTDCNELVKSSAGRAPDIQYKLVATLPGIPTKCGAIVDKLTEGASTPSTPTPSTPSTPPASSAGRAGLGGAVVGALVAFFL